MNSSSIGIIGGADGPTAIFLSGSPLPLAVVGIIIAAAIVALVVGLANRK